MYGHNDVIKKVKFGNPKELFNEIYKKIMIDDNNNKLMLPSDLLALVMQFVFGIVDTKEWKKLDSYNDIAIQMQRN